MGLFHTHPGLSFQPPLVGWGKKFKLAIGWSGIDIDVEITHVQGSFPFCGKFNVQPCNIKVVVALASLKGLTEWSTLPLPHLSFTVNILGHQDTKFTKHNGIMTFDSWGADISSSMINSFSKANRSLREEAAELYFSTKPGFNLPAAIRLAKPLYKALRCWIGMSVWLISRTFSACSSVIPFTLAGNILKDDGLSQMKQKQDVITAPLTCINIKDICICTAL